MTMLNHKCPVCGEVRVLVTKRFMGMHQYWVCKCGTKKAFAGWSRKLGGGL